MRITPILINPIQNNYNTQSPKLIKTAHTPTDMFVRDVDTIIFGARLDERFSKKFLKELLKFDLPCAVCRKKMISLERLNEPACESLPIFEPHLDKMPPINQIIYAILSKLAPHHPEKSIQGLLQEMFPEAERKLILVQRDILDELNFISRDLPEHKDEELRRIISGTFEEIFKRQTDNEKRFKRQRTISKFNNFCASISYRPEAKLIKTIIQRLPTSSSSENAFIVKYAYRDPENIGMKLYPDDFGTLEHIIPESQGGKIVVWACSADNSARGSISINKQHELNPDMDENIQFQIDRLIDIHDNEWQKFTVPNAKPTLKEYIFAVRNDYLIASKGNIRLNIEALRTIPQDVIKREIKRIREIENPRFHKTKNTVIAELFTMLSRNSNKT